MGTTASFHLVRYPWWSVPVELVRFVTQRRHLRRTPGLRFHRVLGTGRGRTMSRSADLRRWALFAVWDDDRDLDAFLASSPVAGHWERVGREVYTVRLEPLAAHGSWGGSQPLGLRHGHGDPDEPVAVLTRATIRWRHLRRFYRHVPPVDSVLEAQPGLLGAVGVGEAPVGRQATFSLWASAADVSRFAYRDPTHAEVVERTRREGWYREELFARFRPYAEAGTWDGVAPLSRAR